MACDNDGILLDVVEGRRALDAPLEAHLAACADCRLVLAAGARGAGETLRDAPGEGAAEQEPAWDELGAGVVVDGRFELLRFLGAGASAIVWAAREIATSAEVALKLALTTEPDLTRRFEREAQITRALGHPNIVKTFELIAPTEARGACLVQELLAGETLAARLERDGALSLQAAARVILPVARALAAAHARGVVHRDVKPQNVFLASDRVVVLDFGIVKLMPDWGSHPRLTRTGALLGTPSVMAPEQIFGVAQIDPRADVWAAGAVLHQTLAGEGPVPGLTFGQISSSLRQGRIRSLSAIRPDLPADVLGLVRRALVVPREHRLAEIAAFVQVLERYA